MIWAVLGGLSLIMGVAGAGYTLYDIISTGAYKDFSVADWLWNIAYLLLMLNPIFSVLGGIGKMVAVVGGVLGKLLMKVPLLGAAVSLLYQTFKAILFWLGINKHLWQKGGFFFRFGEVVASLGRAVVKHPWIMFGLIFSSTMFDGILKRIFQLWGDLSLRAAGFVFDRVGQIMSDKGYGDPITQTVQMLDQSRSALPPCFTAVWGAVNASECMGLIITTFQYLFLLSALVKGYKVLGK